MNLADRSGAIERVADLVRRHGGRLVSILASYDRVARGRRNVFLRARDLSEAEFPDLRDELGKVGERIYRLDGGETGRRKPGVPRVA